MSHCCGAIFGGFFARRSVDGLSVNVYWKNNFRITFSSEVQRREKQCFATSTTHGEYEKKP